MTILNKQEIGFARKLWRWGHDTAFIAQCLHIPEYVVYNGRSYISEKTPRSLAGHGVFSSPSSVSIVQTDDATWEHLCEVTEKGA